LRLLSKKTDQKKKARRERISLFEKQKRERERNVTTRKRDKIKKKRETHLLRAMLLPLLSKNLFRCC
jgi:hypothetical protein